MAILNDLLVRGATRCLNTLYANSLQVDSQILSGDLTVNGYTYMGYSTSRNDTKLSVAGISNDKWYRSTGQVGWYSDSYGGGIYMTDTTYVRVYGSKKFLSSNGVYTGSSATYYLDSSGKLNAVDGVFSGNVSAGTSMLAKYITASEAIRAARYDLQTITQMGENGTLYVSPSIQFPTNTTSSVVTTSSTIAIVDSSITSATLAGVVWRASAKVKISGVINGVVTGTVNGTITSINTSSKTLTIGNLSGGNWSNVVAGTYSDMSKIEKLNIMMYETYLNSTYYPVGILLTSYGAVTEHTDGTAKTYINIYGGSKTTPVVKLGNLTGLSAVEGVTPSGWGLYTENGFFTGVVVSKAGKIGGWSLSENTLYTGTWGANNSAMLCTGSETAKSIGGSAATVNGWVFTAGANFGVTKAGALYANSAHISGEITATSGTIGGCSITNGTLQVANGNITSINASKITAGDISADRMKTNLITAIDAKVTDLSALSATIGGFQIDSTSIHTKDVATTSNADNSIALSSADFTRTINSTSRSGLRFAIGDKFGVTGDGTIYASNATISGAITATSLTLSSGVTIGISQVSNLQSALDGKQATGDYATKTYVTDKGYQTASNVTSAINSQVYDKQFYRYSKDIVVYGDSDKYYPVYFKNNTFGQTKTHKISISREYNEQAPSDWNTSTHKGGLTLNIKWNYGGWGGATYNCEITELGQTYSTMVGDVSVGIGSGMTSVIYLRGGGETGALYHIKCDAAIETTHFNGTFPAIGTNENAGTDYMYRDNSHWKYASPLTTPNTVHLNYLMSKNTAKMYITNIDSNKGITIKPADSSGNDYLQLNSDAISFYRNNVETSKFEDSAIRIGKIGTDKRNVYITDSAVQIRNNESVLAEYGSAIKLYNPTTNNVAVNITSTGASFTGAINATALTLSEGVTIGYSSITGTPTIPTKVSQLTNDSSYATTTNVNNAVNNIKIGGRNLLTGTDKTTEITKTIDSSASSSYTEGKTFSVTRVEGENTYILSFDGKADADGTVVRCHWYSPNTTNSSLSSTGYAGTGGDGYCEVSLTTEWKRYWVKWTQTDTAGTKKNLIVGRIGKPSSGTKTAYYRAIKFEAGNKATDWTPAPEDVASDITTAQTTATNAAKTATSYITYVDTTNGIKIHDSNSTDDYVQVNSSAINMYRNKKKMMALNDSALKFYKNDDATNPVAEFGSSIKLYKPTTTTALVTIDSNGASFNGAVTATSLSTGTKTASTTGKGVYIDSSGNIYAGDGSTNNFTVSNTGSITAKSGTVGGWTLSTKALKTGTWGENNSALLCIGTTNSKSIGGSAATVTGWVLTAGANFGVTKTGALYANSAHIKGDITADSGSIASGVTIGGKAQSEYLNDNIKVGGRNLLKGTNKTFTMKNGILKINLTSYAIDNILGKTLTVSADIKAETAGSIMNCYVRGSSTTLSDVVPFPNMSTNYTHYNIVLTCNSSGDPLTLAFRCNGSAGTTRDVTFTLKNIKLEFGNKATDWTPAPEDIDVHNYITDIDTQNGITIKAVNGTTDTSTTTANYIKLNSDGLEVFKGGSSVALYGDTARIGKENSSNVVIDNKSVNIKEGDISFSKFSGDGARIGIDGGTRLQLSSIGITGITNEGQSSFNIVCSDFGNEQVVVDNGYITNQSSDNTVFQSSFYIGSSIPSHCIVSLTKLTIDYTYQNTSYSYDADFSQLYEYSDNIDEYGSAWVQEDTLTNSNYTITWNLSGSNNSKVIDLTITSNKDDIVFDNQLWYSLTITASSGQAISYTFGNRGNTLNGRYSLTAGESLIADTNCQMAIGRFNNGNSDKAFIVGNGSSDSSRSNAFTVGWDGGISANSLDMTVNSLSTTNNFINCTDTNNSSVFSVTKAGNVNLTGSLTVGSKALFKVVTVSQDNITVNANNAAYPSITVSATGYTPVALGSLKLENASSNGANYTWCICSSYSLSGNTISCYVGNWSTNKNAKIKLTFTVLCALSSLVAPS